MNKLYDETGEEVEGALTAEQAKELQDKLDNPDNSELEEKIKTLEDDKAKLEAKDLNFAKLRGKTKEERDTLTEKWSEEKKGMAEELAAMSDKIDSFTQKNLTSYENEVLTAIAGDDEELKTKIKDIAKTTLTMKPESKDEILTYYQNAATLASGTRPNINPINAYAPTVTSTVPEKKGADYTESAQGKANYQAMFPDSAHGKDK
jgi:hypothetical protein